MKTIHRKRLAKLADYLDTVPRKLFKFNLVVKEGTCGTVGCAIGHSVKVFPRLLSYDPALDRVVTKNEHAMWYRDIAMEIFGMTNHQAGGVFGPDNQRDELGRKYSNLGGNATPKQVAKLIRKFLNDPDQK